MRQSEAGARNDKTLFGVRWPVTALANGDLSPSSYAIQVATD